jgi:outer membrane protein TolC
MYRQAAVFLFAWCILAATALSGQATSLTLEECYALAREHYPMAKQRDLITQSEGYSVDNASNGNLPQVSLYGQASYQSDVPHLPIDLPGMDIPLIPKDQYKLYGEVTQVIYNGGATSLEKEGYEAKSRVEQQGIEVELYKLKERINQLFFGILLLREQIQQVDLLRRDIELGMVKTQAAIDNGIALKSSIAVLQVELLKSHQHVIELEASRHAYLEMLGLMINHTLDENTILVKPAEISPVQEINRPEMTWYDYQRQNLGLQNDLLDVQNRPKVSLFLQGGLGRPGLNIFDDALKGFYFGGVRLYWPLAGFYSVKNEKTLNEISRQGIDVQRETFLFNTQLQLRQENNEISKLQELLTTDDEIVALRKTIKETALNQLENGVITTNDYLREVNAEDNARQSKLLHEIQLRMAQYHMLTTLGQ